MIINKILSHIPLHRFHMYMFGIYPQCQKKRLGSQSLSTALCGETVKISGFYGGRAFESRLRSMGLSVGDEITVFKNSGHYIVAKGTNRLALGAGMAEKIMITAG